MPHDTLISAAELLALRAALPGSVRIFDCSFDLVDATAGARAWREQAVAGAAHLDLNHDLAAPKTGRNGRHPLPTRQAFARRMADCGLDDDTSVVVYDRSGGMYAARAWWMLRWVGHSAVAVLDGGLQAWASAGAALAPGQDSAAAPVRGNFSLRAALEQRIDYTDLRATLGQAGAPQVIDGRAAERFRGENETLDPVGGRIPGARNRFFRDNLQSNGCFKPAAQLRAEWQSVLVDCPPEQTVQQCGSGVTACHNLLALQVAGLGGGRLYGGSWSEWCCQPDAPVARG